MRWTKKDQQYVRQVIDFISANTEGGMSGLARKLDTTRQVVSNWRARGKIPPGSHEKIIDLARKAAEDAADQAKIAANLSPSNLHPLSRDIIKTHEATA